MSIPFSGGKFTDEVKDLFTTCLSFLSFGLRKREREKRKGEY